MDGFLHSCDREACCPQAHLASLFSHHSSHPCSPPSCPIGLPFTALGPPHLLFPLSGLLLRPHLYPQNLLVTLQGLFSIPKSPLPSPGLFLSRAHLSGRATNVSVFAGSVTLSLQPQGSWRAGTCLSILVSTLRRGTGWVLPGMAQTSFAGGCPRMGKPCF